MRWAEGGGSQGLGAVVWDGNPLGPNATNEETAAFMATVQGQGFWYIASPYSKYPGGREEAFEGISKAAGWLINHGVHVFVPISHSHPIALYGNVKCDDHDTWLEQDEAVARASVGICVVRMPTWEDSIGVTRERNWFASWHKPEVGLRWTKKTGVGA